MTDTVTMKYLQQKDIFADLFNFLIYEGDKRIDPENLQEIDLNEIEDSLCGEDNVPCEIKGISVIVMTDGKVIYLAMAIGQQGDICYALPAVNLVYEALLYESQTQKASVKPVVTLTIYFSANEWDGPMSMREMYKEQDSQFLPFVPDCKINLIAPASIADEDFIKFSSSLREVLSFIKYSGDADKLNKLLNTDEGYQKLGSKEVEVLNSCVNANLVMDKSTGTLDIPGRFVK